MVESDAKCCIEAMKSTSLEHRPWKIQSICSNVINLANTFCLCNFSWVRHEANSVAHELAKFSMPLSLPFSCNSDSLPPSVKEAWLSDSLAFGSAL